MPDEPFSLRLYRRLLALYPAGFRENYAGPLEHEFRDELRETTGGCALARPRFCRTAVLCFAGFALLLAVTGIYGMVSYAVARRTREMGVRMALGTTPAHLRAGLLRQSLVTIAAGAVPGIAAAVLSGRLLASLVEGAKPLDVPTYAAAVLCICAIAAVGVWAATRPIARLNIAEILRAE